MSDLLEKRTIQERLIIAKTLLETILDDLPSTQPRKGKWVLDNPHSEIYRYACSECYAHHRARYDFCPSCGADMREGES